MARSKIQTQTLWSRDIRCPNFRTESAGRQHGIATSITPHVMFLAREICVCTLISVLTLMNAATKSLNLSKIIQAMGRLQVLFGRSYSIQCSVDYSTSWKRKAKVSSQQVTSGIFSISFFQMDRNCIYSWYQQNRTLYRYGYGNQ